MSDPTQHDAAAEQEFALFQRLFELVDCRTPSMGAPTDVEIPLSAYLDPDRFERERQLLQASSTVFAHASELKKPGDYVARDELGVPLVAVRQDSGETLGLFNVCRHRGARLVGESSGQLKAFVCPYHGWSYRRDGSLLDIPHPCGFPKAAEATNLMRAGMVERSGMLWVNLRGDPEPELDPALEVALGALDVQSHRVEAAHVFEPEANWKLVIETALEAYHFKRTHQNSVYPEFLDNLGLCERLGDHQRLVQPRRRILELERSTVRDVRLRDYSVVGFFLFPNSFLFVTGPDHLILLTVFPRTIDQSLVRVLPLFPVSSDDPKRRARAVQAFRIPYGEDMVMAESVQSGLRSGANRAHRAGRYEHGIHFFHASLDRALATRG